MYGWPLAEVSHGVGQHHKFECMHFKQLKDLCPLCSLCPTFAAVALFINNARWDGVPFLLKAGKALANRRTEIRVQFRNVPGNLFSDRLSLNGMDLDRSTNELVCCWACWASNTESAARTPLPNLFANEAGQDKSANTAIVT